MCLAYGNKNNLSVLYIEKEDGSATYYVSSPFSIFIITLKIMSYNF